MEENGVLPSQGAVLNMYVHAGAFNTFCCAL